MKLEKRHIEILKQHIPNFSTWYLLIVNGISISNDDVDPKKQNISIYTKNIVNKFYKCNLFFQKDSWENEQRLTFCSGECDSFIEALNQTLIMFAGYIKNENSDLYKDGDCNDLCKNR